MSMAFGTMLKRRQGVKRAQYLSWLFPRPRPLSCRVDLVDRDVVDCGQGAHHAPPAKCELAHGRNGSGQRAAATLHRNIHGVWGAGGAGLLSETRRHFPVRSLPLAGGLADLAGNLLEWTVS